MNRPDPIPPPTARRRWSTIYRAIRERISLLDYQPEQRLSEETLAAEFGTSRTPIRRVLARLEDEGLLRSVQSVGTIVTDVDIETLAQVYRLRMELAELIGRLDPVPITGEIVGRLRAVQVRFAELKAAPDPRLFARINIEFFHAITALTSNEPFREISERLYYRTARIWIKSISQLDLLDEITIFEREVADVLSAVEIGDLPAVGHIRRSHVSMSYRRLLRNTVSGAEE